MVVQGLDGEVDDRADGSVDAAYAPGSGWVDVGDHGGGGAVSAADASGGQASGAGDRPVRGIDAGAGVGGGVEVSVDDSGLPFVEPGGVGGVGVHLVSGAVDVGADDGGGGGGHVRRRR